MATFYRRCPPRSTNARGPGLPPLPGLRRGDRVSTRTPGWSTRSPASTGFRRASSRSPRRSRGRLEERASVPVADVGQAFDRTEFSPGPDRAARRSARRSRRRRARDRVQGRRRRARGASPTWRRQRRPVPRCGGSRTFRPGPLERELGHGRRVPHEAAARAHAVRLPRVRRLRRGLPRRGGVRPAVARGSRVRRPVPALGRPGPARDRRRPPRATSRRRPAEPRRRAPGHAHGGRERPERARPGRPRPRGSTRRSSPRGWSAPFARRSDGRRDERPSRGLRDRRQPPQRRGGRGLRRVAARGVPRARPSTARSSWWTALRGRSEVRALEASPGGRARLPAPRTAATPEASTRASRRARGARLLLANADVRLSRRGSSARSSTRSRIRASGPRRRCASGTRPATLRLPAEAAPGFLGELGLGPAASRPFAPAHARALGAGRRRPAPRRRRPRGAPRRLRPRRPLRRAVPVRVRGDGVGGARPPRGAAPCASSRGRARGISSRGARSAIPRPKRGARPRAAGIARSDGGRSAGRSARPRGRAARFARPNGARGSPSPRFRRATGPGSPSRPTRSLVPFAGSPLAADSGCPRTCSRRCARGPSTCAHSIAATAGRSRRASGRSRERFEIREATAADAPGIRRLFEKVFGDRAVAGGVGLEVRAGSRRLVRRRGRRSTERSSATTPAGARDFCSTARPALLYSVGDVATDPGVRGLGGRRGVYRAMTDAFYDARRPGRRAVLLRVPERPRAQGLREDRRLAHAPPGALGQGAGRGLRRRRPPTRKPGELVDESFDPLWESARRGISHGAVRDRGRVNWRFHARPNRYYRMVWRRGARRDDRLGRALGRRRRRDGRRLPGPRRRRAPTFPRSSPPPRTKRAASAPRHLAFWIPPGGPGRSDDRVAAAASGWTPAFR